MAYGDGAIQMLEKHAEVAICDSPQLVKRETLQRGWVRRALIGMIVLEALGRAVGVLESSSLAAPASVPPSPP